MLTRLAALPGFILRKAERDGPLVKRQLRDAVQGKDRGLFEEALDGLLTSGKLAMTHDLKYAAGGRNAA